MTTLLAAFLTLGTAATAGAAEKAVVRPELCERAVGVIRQALDREQRWPKVHVAEYLLALDYPEGVKEAFSKELDLHGTEPEYRIGIWRVLARCSATESERNKWIAEIRNVLADPAAPDRLHAAETLAKLGYRFTEEEIPSMERLARSEDSQLAGCVAWVLANTGRPGAEERLVEFFDSPEAKNRLVAAYAFRLRESVMPATRERLLKQVEQEPVDSEARVYVVAATAVHGLPGSGKTLKKELIEFAIRGKTEEKVEACQTLAQIGGAADLPMLTGLLDDSEADPRASAANAILRIGRKTPHRLAALDWIVIGLYALGMLSIGWYYSRRTKTREEYLLGGRQMRPLAVGISLFASLISTVSYLSWPGEIIRHGPMMLGAVFAYPFIGLVVGRLMIPFIMRLRVTSAYEILEVRLGGAVRMLGSLLFLSLRLLWMSVIVYATATKVLVPLLGLPPNSGPLVCGLLAFLTIGYTAMGGLRAVVVTDVVQAAILLGAALVSVITITVWLGGVQAWWPSHWPAHWPEPRYGYDPTVRVTLFGAMLATFTWYVCTSASDQIAIQRYLSTKDAKAARTVLFVSLAADVLVSCLLAAVGLGLLAYFRANPHLIPDGQTILTDSDKLFPQFIMIGLPVGLSGLVVAGLLACATSSLAAGINSTCSVITVDLIERFRREKTSEAGRVRQLKYVSVVVGLIVVALSLFVNMVQGNLLEVCYKVVNLLTAPLAGLFFLAMFVPWARGFGALVGAACGLVVVVAISYWKELTGTQGISFLWAMPMSLIVEVGVGALVSLIPIGKKPAPLESLKLGDQGKS